MAAYLYVFAGVVLLIVTVLYWLGVLSPMRVKESIFKGGVFIYSDYQGHIKNVGKAFTNTILKDRDTYRKTMARPISLPPMGIYYDDP